MEIKDLKALNIFTSKDITRLGLQCIHFENGEAVSTNGHILFRVQEADIPKDITSDISTSDADLLVKTSVKNGLPLRIEGNEITNEVVTVKSQEDACFPDYKPVIPDEEDTVSLGLSLENLEKIVKMLKVYKKGHQTPHIRLEIPEYSKSEFDRTGDRMVLTSVRFYVGGEPDIDGVVMPVHVNKKGQ